MQHARSLWRPRQHCCGYMYAVRSNARHAATAYGHSIHRACRLHQLITRPHNVGDTHAPEGGCMRQVTLRAAPRPESPPHRAARRSSRHLCANGNGPYVAERSSQRRRCEDYALCVRPTVPPRRHRIPILQPSRRRATYLPIFFEQRLHDSLDFVLWQGQIFRDGFDQLRFVHTIEVLRVIIFVGKVKLIFFFETANIWDTFSDMCATMHAA